MSEQKGKLGQHYCIHPGKHHSFWLALLYHLLLPLIVSVVGPRIVPPPACSIVVAEAEQQKCQDPQTNDPTICLTTQA